jgi:tRNA G18 (ribose-2'-O)-methylase SpoU
MLFLYDIQSPINIGLILRVAEQFRIPAVVYDPHRVLEDEHNLMKVSDFSCGALGRHPPKLIESLAAYRQRHAARVIATSLNRMAIPLQDFAFEANDIILLGNEYDGLPSDVIAEADESLYIPLPPDYLPKPRSYSPIDAARTEAVSQNGIPNLNVAITSGIISYVFRSQRPVGL